MINLKVRQLAVAYAFDAALARLSDGRYWDGAIWVVAAQWFAAAFNNTTGYFEKSFDPNDLANGDDCKILVRDSRSLTTTAIVPFDFAATVNLTLPLPRPAQAATVNFTAGQSDAPILQLKRAAVWSQAVRFLSCPDLTGATATFSILSTAGAVVIGPRAITLTAPVHAGQPYNATLGLSDADTTSLTQWQYALRVQATLSGGAIIDLVPAATIAMYE